MKKIRNKYTETKSRAVNYDIYQLDRKEKIRYITEGFILCVFLGYLFYQSIYGILAVSPLLYLYIRKKKTELSWEQKWKLNLEFKDGILAWSASLEAGYSAEGALEEAYKELDKLNQSSVMIRKEFSYILNQIRMNIPIETALEDFAVRTELEDIQSFSEVFRTAKRSGGDLIHIIKLTCTMISDKIEVKRDILTLVTAKRLEANIMKTVPLLFLIYLSLSSPGFLDPLYHNLFGILVMTIFLLLYLSSYLIIDKIISIEV